MNETALAILAGFPPVFAVIGVGWACRATGLLPDPVWAGVNRLNYRILLPAVLFVTLSRADFTVENAGALMAASALSGVALGGLGWLALLGARARSGERAALIAVVSAWNLFLFLALAQSVFGAAGAALAPAVLAPGALTAALLAVSAMARSNGKLSWKVLAFDPVLMGAIAGLAANAAALPENAPALMAPIDILGAGALGVILLAIGGGLRFGALRGRLGLLVRASVARAAVSPLIFLAFGLLFGLSGEPLAILVLAGATPAAAFVYAVVREHDGPAEIAAGMITASAALSALVSPLLTVFAATL